MVGKKHQSQEEQPRKERMVVGKKHQSQEEQPRKERMVVGLGVCLWWRFCVLGSSDLCTCWSGSNSLPKRNCGWLGQRGFCFGARSWFL